MKNNKLKIAVDFDGCLAKTSDFICQLINFRTGSNHSYKEISSWDYWDRIGKSKDFWDAYDFLDTSKNGRLILEPYDEHTCSVLTDLNYKNQEEKQFDIVTANNHAARNQIYDWININCYSDPNYPMVFEVKCIGRKTAAEKLALDYDIYIDDNPHLAEAAQDFTNKQVFMANAPWNKHIKNSNNVKRFESWKEIPNLIKV